MMGAGVPSAQANKWATESIEQLKAPGLTDADITNIPWNGANK